MSKETDRIKLTAQEKEQHDAWTIKMIEKKIEPFIAAWVESAKIEAKKIREQKGLVKKNFPDYHKQIDQMMNRLVKQYIASGDDETYTLIHVKDKSATVKPVETDSNSLPPTKADEKAETSIENFARNRKELLSKAGRMINPDTLLGAEMCCLVSNYFRSQWKGSTTKLEDIRIPYTQYLQYVIKEANHHSEYPENWDKRLMATLILEEGWMFCNWNNVLHLKPISGKGQLVNVKINHTHPVLSQKEDLDYRLYATEVDS